MIKFNDYNLIRQLGEGGMATVHLAQDLVNDREVAIKILKPEYVLNRNIRNRFIDEAKNLLRLEHPNIVKVYDYFNDEKDVAIVMQYISGSTLKDIISESKLSDNEIKDLLKDMVSALSYIHKEDLIHRDIKPSNFIQDKNGKLILTDFGISKDTTEQFDDHTLTSTSMNLGTPMYMSPEQIKSIKGVTKLTDIYSLGVILWEMVSGKRVYDNDTLSTFDLQLKIVQEKLPLTNTIWDGLIQKATEKSEHKRLSDINNFLLPKKFISDDDKTLLAPDYRESNIQKPRKKKYLFLVLLTLTVASIGVFSWVKFVSIPSELQVQKNSANDSLWSEVVEVGTIEKYQKYIDSLPNGKYTSLATHKIDSLKEEKWESVEEIDGITSYRKYIDSFPNSKYVSEAEKRLKEIENKYWNKALKEDEPMYYHQYIDSFPEGKYISLAQTKIESFEKNKNLAIKYKNPQGREYYKVTNSILFWTFDNNRIWYAKKDFPLYAKPYDRRAIETIKKGEKIIGLDVEYHYYKMNRVVVQKLNMNSPFDGCPNGDVKVGDTILLLNSEGECYWNAINNNRFIGVHFSDEGKIIGESLYDGCNMIEGKRISFDEEYIVWVKVQSRSREIGWIRFSSREDFLNNVNIVNASM